jgi:hypothetical protein
MSDRLQDATGGSFFVDLMCDRSLESMAKASVSRMRIRSAPSSGPVAHKESFSTDLVSGNCSLLLWMASRPLFLPTAKQGLGKLIVW